MITSIHLKFSGYIFSILYTTRLIYSIFFRNYAFRQDLEGEILRYIQVTFTGNNLLASLKLGDTQKAGPDDLREGHWVALNKNPFIYTVFNNLVLEPDDPGSGLV